ncbi:MAG: enoyl-CoA hydratase/isomerase family protein [Chloroflexota bacterium]
MGQEDILYTAENGIAVVTLNRPEKMNAISFEMHDLLEDVVKRVGDDKEVRALIITGAGRAFCAGTDVSGSIALSLDLTMHLAGLDKGTFDRPNAWWFANLPQPTVAAVNGAAVGAGAELALMCDFRIASEKARFGWIFPQRGLIPDAGAATYLLSRIVGLTKALEITLSGEMIGAEEALRIGLVSKVVPEDQLMTAAKEFAERVTRGAPLSIRMIKRLVYRGLENDMEAHLAMTRELLGICYQTEDAREGVMSFLEKRTPVWKGR